MGAKFSVKEILDITGGTLVSGRPELAFEGVAIDSRQVAAGDLFVAIVGKRLDGHDFIPEAIRRGARGILAQEVRPVMAEAAAAILVSDTTKALGDLGHAHRERFTVPVIAITGSAGKTTTKEMVVSILEKRWKVLKTQGNLNNLIGLPLTLFNLTKTHEICVLELGTNQPGEIARLAQIAHPSIACVTNIGPAHLEGLGSLAGVAEEKGSLFDSLGPEGTAVVNLDDSFVREMKERLKCRIITYGRRPEANVKLERIWEKQTQGVVFSLSAGNEAQKVKLATPAEHNISNALAAAAIAWAAGAELKDIAAGLEDFRPVPGRMEIIALANGACLINDVYNANPLSCEAALHTLKEMKGRNRGFVFLGDMLELGEEGESRHRSVGEILAEVSIEKAYLKGELVKYVAQGAKEKGLKDDQMIFFERAEDVLPDFFDRLSAGDWILVKGSRGMKMEELVDALVNRFGRQGGSGK